MRSITYDDHFHISSATHIDIGDHEYDHCKGYADVNRGIRWSHWIQMMMIMIAACEERLTSPVSLFHRKVRKPSRPGFSSGRRANLYLHITLKSTPWRSFLTQHIEDHHQHPDNEHPHPEDCHHVHEHQYPDNGYHHLMIRQSPSVMVHHPHLLIDFPHFLPWKSSNLLTSIICHSNLIRCVSTSYLKPASFHHYTSSTTTTTTTKSLPTIKTAIINFNSSHSVGGALGFFSSFSCWLFSTPTSWLFSTAAAFSSPVIFQRRCIFQME